MLDVDAHVKHDVQVFELTQDHEDFRRVVRDFAEQEVAPHVERWDRDAHFPTDLVAAAAPICGMTDLVVDYHATRPDLRPYSEEMMGGTPEEFGRLMATDARRWADLIKAQNITAE